MIEDKNCFFCHEDLGNNQLTRVLITIPKPIENVNKEYPLDYFKCVGICNECAGHVKNELNSIPHLRDKSLIEIDSKDEMKDRLQVLEDIRLHTECNINLLKKRIMEFDKKCQKE